MKPVTLADLRHHAITSSLFPATTLGRAIAKLGFVQADPIRSPARAQDLILRQRVVDYRSGDLERRYTSMKLEEDFLYAYGFMPLPTWQLLHPRTGRPLSKGEKKVLDLIPRKGRIHPRELEKELGKEREVNAWGGYSKATTRALERLHYFGLIRVAGRVSGIRIYERLTATHTPANPDARLQRLVLLIAGILAPLSETSLRATIRHLGHAAPDLEGRRDVVPALLRSGALSSAMVDDVRYVWPEGRLTRREPEHRVRFLAPFDPVVWDRRRFEHFWGWPYRFEAYTPPKKRKLGYYALPLLWRAEVIGWVNASNRNGEVTIEAGYVSGHAPEEQDYKSAFEEEALRLRTFLAERTNLV